MKSILSTNVQDVYIICDFINSIEFSLNKHKIKEMMDKKAIKCFNFIGAIIREYIFFFKEKF